MILDKNPLPFITGTLCAHNCMTKCTRNFYEEPVDVRGTKLMAAKNGYESVLPSVKAKAAISKKTAVVGGGPAGIAAAYFLAREGADVTIFEKEAQLGGVIRYVIPEFRIADSDIEKDLSFIKALGVTVRTGREIGSVQELKDEGFDSVILAVGAHKHGILSLEKGEVRNALEFLREYKEKKGELSLGKNVVVIGGGNTAMDTARAASRVKGVEKVSLVYRRTKRYMPAAEDELLEVLGEGIQFCELLSPVSLEKGSLLCRKMELTQADESGRAGVKETDEWTQVPADTVIAAVGENVPTEFYQANGLTVNEKGRLRLNTQT